MNKNSEISLKIMLALDSGMSLPEAFDHVLGDGAYLRLCGAVLDEANGVKS